VAAYATPAQWAASDYALATMPADPEAQRRLNRASRIIDEMIITAIYDVDDDGLPTDTKIADALRDATCAQAEYMASAGDPLGIGATNQISSFSIGSVSVTRKAGQNGSDTPSRYAPAAWTILQQAGLTGQGPITGWQ